MAADLFKRIKEALPLWEVASRYGGLNKGAGGARVMNCLFHAEKTGSMQVFDDHYHCFGCGAHGDVFDLVEHQERMDKREVLEFLAHLAGIPADEVKALRGRPENPQVREERDLVLEILGLADTFYRQALESAQAPGAAKAREELASRQLPPQVLDRVGFGYAPDAWSALSDHLEGLGYKPDQLVRTGIVVRAKSGRPVDLLRHRLVVPIRNKAGRVISFAGRALPGSTLPQKKDESGKDIEPPKYVNGSESPVFTKGNHLFGLDQALSMRGAATWVQVEGYFDATALLGAGIPAVAPMGTALTEAQAKELAKCAQKILVWQDPDPAGQKATRKAIPLLLAQGLRVEVVRPVDLGQGTKWDPDLVVRRLGAEATRTMLLATGSRALEDWTAWLIPHICTTDGLSRSRKQDRLEILRRIAAVLVEGFPEATPPRAQLDLLAMELEVPVNSVLGAITSERRDRSQDRLRAQQEHALKGNQATPLPSFRPPIWMALEAMADGDVRGLEMVRQVDQIDWEMIPHGHLVLELLDSNGVPESPLAVAAMAEASTRRRQKAAAGDLRLLHVLLKRETLTIRLDELDQALNSSASLDPAVRERLVRERMKAKIDMQALGGGFLRKTLGGTR